MFIWLMIHERLLAAVSEAFHVFVSPFHETMIYILIHKGEVGVNPRPTTNRIM